MLCLINLYLILIFPIIHTVENMGFMVCCRKVIEEKHWHICTYTYISIYLLHKHIKKINVYLGNISMVSIHRYLLIEHLTSIICYIDIQSCLISLKCEYGSINVYFISANCEHWRVGKHCDVLLTFFCFFFGTITHIICNG